MDFRSGIEYPIQTLILRTAQLPRTASTPNAMNVIRTCLGLFLILSLQACVSTGPDYIPPQQTLPSTWQTDLPNAVTAKADLSAWWRQFTDPTLSALIEDALRASPDARSAGARLREARARSELATAQFWPSVEGGVSVNRSLSSQESGSGSSRTLYRAGFDARWELDLFGGLRRGAEAAQAELQASEYGLQGVQVSLAAEVARNYLEMRAYEARLAIAQANLTSQQETLQLTDWRAQAGLASHIDLERARANVEQTRALIPGMANALALTRHRLATLLGLQPGQIEPRLTSAQQLPTPPEALLVAIPAETLQQRPDVRAAERRLAAETARVGQRMAARYPGLNLSGSLGLEALSLSGLGPDAVSRSLLASFSAVLFDGGRLRRQVAIQSAVQEQALIQYEATVLIALEEIENALATLGNTRRRLTALTEAARAAGEAARLAHDRYAAGLIDFQTVLDAERSRLNTEDSLKATEAEQALAVVQLYKALGGGWRRQDAPKTDRNPT